MLLNIISLKKKRKRRKKDENEINKY